MSQGQKLDHVDMSSGVFSHGGLSMRVGRPQTNTSSFNHGIRFCFGSSHVVNSAAVFLQHIHCRYHFLGHLLVASFKYLVTSQPWFGKKIPNRQNKYQTSNGFKPLPPVSFFDSFRRLTFSSAWDWVAPAGGGNEQADTTGWPESRERKQGQPAANRGSLMMLRAEKNVVGLWHWVCCTNTLSSGNHY